MQVINSLKSRIVRLPVNSSTDLVAGSLMIRGTTAETNLGTAIVNAAASASGYIGHLVELHDYSVNGSALVAGAAHSAVIADATGAAWFAPMGGNPDIFPSRQIELIEGMTLCRADYKLTGAAMTTSSVTVTPGSTGENNIDTGFLYCTVGTGIGELRFIDTVNGTTSLTTSVAFTTGGTAFVKILPLLHGLFVLTVGDTTTETQIATTNAVGAARLVQLERHIVRNGADEMLDPYTHGNLSALDHLTQLKFYGVFGLCSTVFSPLS